MGNSPVLITLIVGVAGTLCFITWQAKPPIKELGIVSDVLINLVTAICALLTGRWLERKDLESAGWHPPNDPTCKDPEGGKT